MFHTVYVHYCISLSLSRSNFISLKVWFVKCSRIYIPHPYEPLILLHLSMDPFFSNPFDSVLRCTCNWRCRWKRKDSTFSNDNLGGWFATACATGLDPFHNIPSVLDDSKHDVFAIQVWCLLRTDEELGTTARGEGYEWERRRNTKV